MPYDPNDPNMGSQDPTQSQESVTPEAATAALQLYNQQWNALPDVQAWKAAHPNGIQSDADRASMGQLQNAHQNLFGSGLVIKDDGSLGPPPAPSSDFFPTLIKGASAVFGPILGGMAISGMMGGAVPAATAGGYGPLAGGYGAATTAAGASVPASLAADAPLASSAFGLGMTPAAINATTASGAGLGGGGGIMSHLLGTAGKTGLSGGLSDLAKGIGTYAQSDASNRYAKAGLTQRYDQLVNQDAAATRAQESDAMSKLYGANIIQNWQPTPDNVQTPAGIIHPNSNGPVYGPSADQKAAMSSLVPTLLKRMTPGGAITPTDPSTYMNPSAGENAANTGGLIISGIGAAAKAFGL